MQSTILYICQEIIPALKYSASVIYSLDRILRCPDLFTPNNWILCLTSLNHALLILNASTNFIIYTAVGEDFKMSLRQILSG